MTAEGWAFPTTSARKCHFIKRGRSLCGRYGYWGEELWADTGQASPDDCKACRVKLEKGLL